MAISNTTNLNLNKPSLGTRGWNTYINDNMDILDSAYKNTQDKIGDTTQLLTGSDCVEAINNLLYQPPTITLSSTPSIYLYKYGQSITSTVLNLAITKKSYNINQVIYKRNGSTIYTNNTPNNTSDSHTDNTVLTDTTTFQATVYDGKTNTNSNILTFTFVYQMLQGKVAKTVTNPTAAQVKALGDIIKTKQNITQAFTLADEKAVFAYPVSYGNLTSIIDQNGFDITGSFIKTTVDITMDDSTVVSYNVYTMNNSVTVTNFNITFKF